MGSERHIVCFEGLLLVMLAIGTQNVLLSCFLTYIISGVRMRLQQCCAAPHSRRRSRCRAGVLFGVEGAVPEQPVEQSAGGRAVFTVSVVLSVAAGVREIAVSMVAERLQEVGCRAILCKYNNYACRSRRTVT